VHLSNTTSGAPASRAAVTASPISAKSWARFARRRVGFPASFPVGTIPAAGAVGIGSVNDGDSFISLGTSCQLVRVGRTYRPNIDALVHAFAHALPERWYQMGAMLTGASLMAWGATVLGREVGDLIGSVEAAFTQPSDLTVLPYLTGERCPYPDPEARGVFFGMSLLTKKGDLARAVMEGVAYGLKQMCDLIRETNPKLQFKDLILFGSSKLLKRISEPFLKTNLFSDFLYE